MASVAIFTYQLEIAPENQQGPDRRARIDRVRPHCNDLIIKKKLSSHIRDESVKFDTPAVPPWFPPLRQAPPLHGQSSCMDNNPCAHTNVWQVRLSYLRIAAFRSQLRKDFLPGSLPRLAPYPGSLAGFTRRTRFHHRFFRTDWLELCHKWWDWSIGEWIKTRG